jgi:hypothetical protein
MDKNARSPLRFARRHTWRRLSPRGHPRLPVSEINREVVHRKRRRLLIAPRFGNRPQHVRIAGNFLRKGSPLHVSHHAASCSLFHSGELTACDQGRRWRARVSAFGGHEVSKVKPSGPCSHHGLPRLRHGFGSILNGERVRTTATRDDKSFHGQKFSRRDRVPDLGRRTYARA